jgi:hypothetical protein
MLVMRRIFLDTEFTDQPWSGHSELLWVGLADEDGASWSALSADVSTEAHLSEFVKTEVVPLSPMMGRDLSERICPVPSWSSVATSMSSGQVSGA